MEAHAQAVARLAATARQFFKRGEPYRIFHGSTHTTRPRLGKRSNFINTSAFSNILQIDVESRTALVESNVPMDHLVASTIKHNLIPPVVMEFPGITVGGGFSGISAESSSFKYGSFDRTVQSIEIVLADGQIVKASKQTNSDLFYGAAGSHGTFGTITLVELNLIQAKKLVKIEYHSRPNVKETVELIQQLSSGQSYDFIEGILFSKDYGVVITGKMTDEDVPNLQTFSYPTDPWFYLHALEKTCSATGPTFDFTTLPEYLFRHDRGAFWVAGHAFGHFHIPLNKLTRWLFDDVVRSRMLYKALHSSNFSESHIIQDLGVPYSSAEAFIDYVAESFGFWPLWLCPSRVLWPLPQPSPRLSLPLSEGIAVGLWGFSRASGSAFHAQNRDLEHRLFHDFQGFKALYAHTYYTEEDFWEIYDKSSYDSLRKKYNATSLPSIYDKVKVNVQALSKQDQHEPVWRAEFASTWPRVAFLGAVKKAIDSKAYLPRRPPWRQ